MSSGLLGAIVAWALVQSEGLVSSYGIRSQLIAIAATSLLMVSGNLDRRQHQLSWTPTKAPLVVLLALVGGGILWWGAGYSTLLATAVGESVIYLAYVQVR